MTPHNASPRSPLGGSHADTSKSGDEETAQAPAEGSDPTITADSRRDVGRHMRAFAIAQVAVRFIGLGVVVVVARALSNDDFGRYSVALALSSMLTIPVGGMGAYLVREGTQAPARLGIVLGQVMSLQTLGGVVVVAASVVLGILLHYDSETLTATVLLTVAAMAVVVTRSQMAVLVCLKRAREYAAFFSLQALVLAVLTVSAALSGAGPVGIAVASLVTAALSVPAAQVLLRRHWKLRVTFQRDGVGETFRVGVAYSASEVGNALLTYLDAVMVQAMRGNGAAAQYSAAYRLHAAIRMVPQIYGDSLSQPVARLAGTDRHGLTEVFNRATSQLFILGVPVALGGVLLGESLMTAVFGDRYAGTGTIAGLLLLTLVVTFPRQAVVICALAVGLERRVVTAYVVTVVVNLVANLILIPLYGAAGAAIAMVISTPVFSVFMAFQLGRAGIHLERNARYLKALLAGLAMCAVVLLTRDLPLVIPVLAGAAAYLGSLRALNTLDADDLDMLPGGKRLKWMVRASRPSHAQ